MPTTTTVPPPSTTTTTLASGDAVAPTGAGAQCERGPPASHPFLVDLN
ncbi:MAG: hypothetical protein M3163_02715 [Actinomycetota bacterium]|nr:hypothetical protein [Actinomycetota bacterium]